MERFYVVKERVTDIRKEPIAPKQRYIYDELQATQAIYNEILLCREEIDEWIYVEAIEQKILNRKDQLQGYPGWVEKDKVALLDTIPEGDTIIIKKRRSPLFLEPSNSSPVIINAPFGSRLWLTGNSSLNDGCNYFEVSLYDKKNAWVKEDDANFPKNMENKKDLRKDIVGMARLFLGIPYLWGGRSIDEGVDCSGLINLVYRVINIDLPRDSHDQWVIAKKINSYELKPGDLIFISQKHIFDRINHVMVYTGGDKIIEAYETGSKVREIGFKERFGIELKDIDAREILLDDRCIYFCRVRELV